MILTLIQLIWTRMVIWFTIWIKLPSMVIKQQTTFFSKLKMLKKIGDHMLDLSSTKVHVETVGLRQLSWGWMVLLIDTWILRTSNTMLTRITWFFCRQINWLNAALSNSTKPFQKRNKMSIQRTKIMKTFGMATNYMDALGGPGMEPMEILVMGISIVLWLQEFLQLSKLMINQSMSWLAVKAHLDLVLLLIETFINILI